MVADQLHPEEEAIMELLRSQEEEDRTRGIEALLAWIGPRLAAMLKRRFSLGDEEIDQALIAVAYRLWCRADAFDPARGSLGGLARRIALDEGVNAIRDRRHPTDARLLPIDERVAAPSETEDLTPPQRRDALCDALHEVIRSLPPMQRRIAEADLAHPEACAPARELAGEISTSVESVYVHRHRYKTRISRELRERGLAPA